MFYINYVLLPWGGERKRTSESNRCTIMKSSWVQDRMPLTNVKWEHHQTWVIHSHFHTLDFSKAYFSHTNTGNWQNTHTHTQKKKNNSWHFTLKSHNKWTGKPHVGYATLPCGQVHSYSISFISSHFLRLRMGPHTAPHPLQTNSKINRAATSKNESQINALHLQKLSWHILAFKYWCI